MEEEMTMTVEGQGDPGSSEGESGVDMPTISSTKRSRGRPKGSKKLQVWVTHVDLSEFGSGIANGGAAQPLRSRGRPKSSGNKHKVPEREPDSLNPPKRRSRGRPKGPGLKELVCSEEGSGAGTSTRKRGRPKGSTNRKTLSKFADAADDWDLTIGGSFQPKKARGMPKRSTSLKRSAESSKSEEEEDGDPGPPRRRGRPKGSPNKKPRLAKRREASSEWESQSDSSGGRKSRDEGSVAAKQTMEDSSNDGYKSSPRGRGRPRKDRQGSEPEQRVPGGSQPAKRGPGRPKGSPNKTYPLVNRSDGRPRKPSLPFIHTERFGPKPKGRGRPKKEIHKRGRPRKNPLSPAGDTMRPKVWKPLGRPRKYPRLDPPETPAPPSRRARGRPRKSEIKRGFISRKAAAQPTVPSDGRSRPRGRPSVTVKDTPTRKRGRPKGSVNKSKAVNQTQAAEREEEEEEEEEEAAAVAVEVEVEEDAGENDDGIAPLEEADETEKPAEDM